ncbi:MAG: hypothetical protein KDF65_08670, partial [Anaerolineae bacterium]|nr:hypothetical protein [Anaerolineae bacterium]
PATPSQLYAGTSRGVFKSVNGGLNWQASSQGLPANITVFSLSIRPNHPNTLYAGTTEGVFKSVDAGSSWNGTDNLLVGQQILVVTVDAVANIVYAGTPTGLYASTDDGSSWQSLGADLPTTGVKGISGGNEWRTIYLGTTAGIFKGNRGSDNWVGLSNGLVSRDILTLAVDPLQTDKLYAGTAGGGVFSLTQAPSLFMPLVYRN